MRLSVALTVSLALLVAGCAFLPALLHSPSPSAAGPEAKESWSQHRTKDKSNHDRRADRVHHRRAPYLPH